MMRIPKKPRPPVQVEVGTCDLCGGAVVVETRVRKFQTRHVPDRAACCIDCGALFNATLTRKVGAKRTRV